MSKTSTLSEWNWWANSNNGIPVSSATVAPLEDDNDTNFELLVNYIGVTDEEATKQLHQYSDDYVSLSCKILSALGIPPQNFVLGLKLMLSCPRGLLLVVGVLAMAPKTARRQSIMLPQEKLGLVTSDYITRSSVDRV
ncbi:unnamed protein product [Prunus brigantina]